MSDPAASAPVYPDIDVEVTALVARELSDIARILLAPGSPEETLAHIVRLTSQTIDGCDQCGVCSAHEVDGSGLGLLVGRAIRSAQRRAFVADSGASAGATSRS